MFEHIGAVFVEAEGFGDTRGKGGEAAGHERGMGAVTLHGGDQLAAARHQRYARGNDVVDDAERQVLQERDALAQRRLEGDLAVHGARGDGCHLVADAGDGGQFVDAFLADHGGPAGTLSLLITGDEEGPSINGTVKLLDWALKQGHEFSAALVGEPTCVSRLGDMVKIGRRGSLSATIRVPGRQGHAAYPHLADNPVPRLVRLVHRLANAHLDDGTTDFQPSNLELTSVDVGNPAFNVIPGEATARFNVRFNDRWTVASLTDFIRAELDAAADGDAYELTVIHRASESFLTRSDALIAPLARAIEAVTGITPDLSTGGGTSDARFFKGVCPVVEFGLVGDTMHQVDERAPIDDLTGLAAIYRDFLDRYFATAADA